MFYLSILPIRSLARSLTYTAAEPIPVGSLVAISIRGRRAYGLVTACESQPPAEQLTLLPIEQRVYDFPIVTAENLQVIQWISRRYACPLNSVLESALPAFIRQGKALTHTACLCPSEERTEAISKRATHQQAVYDWVCQHPFAEERALHQAIANAHAALRQLIASHRIQRVFDRPPEAKPSISITLTQEQQAIADALTRALESRTYATHVLYGITGSGKTEIYHALIAQARRLGLQTLYLVPEIALSEQALAKLQQRLASQAIRVGVWHSLSTDREKKTLWQQALTGTCDVVLGTRSALFLPFKRLGLILVDEEQDASYKQSEVPRYHGRDLAIYRAQLHQALCVLGSATPSIETWHQVKKDAYVLHTLWKRPNQASVPTIQFVDMHYEKPSFEGAYVLSDLLRQKINARLDRKEQTLLFLNRRGYAPYLYCPKCARRIECPYCRSTLVFHKADASFRCHVCQHQVTAYTHCTHCHSPLRLSRGLGTQRVEVGLKKLYPNARILRLDTDNRERQPHWYEAIMRHQCDIIIGTQLLAKGMDFPDLTLVGVLQLDTPALMEDFRASERIFQLLVQVSGRAGRLRSGSEVVVQTFALNDPCIDFVKKQDTIGFLNQEWALRERYRYPPFRTMVRHVFRSLSEPLVDYTVKQWSAFLEQNAPETWEILGPSSPFISKANRYYRRHLLYLGEDDFVSQLQALRSEFKAPPEVIDLLDVDPVDFR